MQRRTVFTFLFLGIFWAVGGMPFYAGAARTRLSLAVPDSQATTKLIRWRPRAEAARLRPSEHYPTTSSRDLRFYWKFGGL